ncbi:hypothetical protein [Streptomyces sp. NBC_00728]|uniref:hypothetical protein n=1 Tax=Streptomyces sp. NBC_00728 TaxID=2903676 RepID=UPI00386E1E4B
MAVEQLPGQVQEFAKYLNGLVARLDQGGGWCGVFWQRDPDGMRACLDGWEVPPWDVVEALLQDVAAEYGERAAAQETERARVLHEASLAAYDTRPGGRDALGDRLDVMLREQRYAAERQAELSRLLPSAASREEAEAIRLDLAWAQDDHERATARCTELRRRMADFDRNALPARAPGSLTRPAPAAGGGAWTRQPENWADPFEPVPFEPRAFEPAPSVPLPPEPEAPQWGPSERGGARRAPESGTPSVHPGADRGAHSGARTGVGHGTHPGARDVGAGSGVRPATPGPGPNPGTHARVPEQTAPWSPPKGHASDGEAGRPSPPSGHAAGGGAGSWSPPSDRTWDGEAGSWPPPPRHAAGGAAVPGSPLAGHSPGGEGMPGSARTDSVPGGDAESASPVPAPMDGRGRTAPRGTAPRQRSKRRPRGSARFAGMAEPDAAPMAVPEAARVLPAAPEPGRRTPRGARFAGGAEEPAPMAVPEAAPVLPTAPEPGRRTPRGARFAGAAEEPARARTEAEPPDDDARRLIADIVGTLTRLRGEGRSGEAHALLAEAAYWPPARLPLLAAELHRAGLDADWAGLLWESASLPADRLVAAADALTAAGRTDDGRQMLRQGVTRPAPEIGAAVLGLADEGRGREIGALLDAYVRVRTPEEAARSAETDPHRLVPLLLRAARSVSDECHWDLVHALRVAGFAA